VGRLPRHLILLSLLSGVLGLAGCILFTDPINEAPVVTIDQPSGPVVSGSSVEIVGRATDDQDSEGSLSLDWAEFYNPKNLVCSSITRADWIGVPTIPRGNGASYEFKPASPNTVCVCARATDHNGASSFKCLAITPSNPPPVATIVDASIPSFGSGQSRPLCSQIHLSAKSTIPPGDKPTFTWSMDYEGNDSSGKLAECTGVTADKDQHRCFSASAPGTYTVTLSIQDAYTSNGNPRTSDKVLAQFVVSVAPDAPACLQRTEPDIFARTILLSRSSDLGSSYQSRTFVVDSVDDDCQPFPRTSTSQTPAQLVWSILDGTSASPKWVYPVTSSNSFVISQSMFPNARPGDTVKLRVEVQDTPTQYNYGHIPNYQIPLCAGDLDTCCKGGTCGSSACVRWTTWTVQFQP
jgi:hypothetical protein